MDHIEVRKKMMANGFSEVFGAGSVRFRNKHGQCFDVMGNEMSDKPVEPTPEPDSTPDPAAEFIETIESVEPDPVGDELENRIHVNGKLLEDAEKDELRDYANNILGLNLHHNTGKEKLIAKIREADNDVS